MASMLTNQIRVVAKYYRHVIRGYSFHFIGFHHTIYRKKCHQYN